MKTGAFRITTLICAQVLTATAISAQVSPITVKPARLARYMGNGGTLSFVASAVSTLGDCLAPLEFRELRRDALQILEIICTDEVETRFARLTFMRVQSKGRPVKLIPFRIEFLP